VGKSVVFAVAGSGKTTRLVSELDLHARVLILTFTENNEAEIRRRVCAKFGHLPANVTVQTYFTFLNRFCYRPLLLPSMKSTGLSFQRPSAFASRQPAASKKRYLDGSGRIYHARMARALQVIGDVGGLRLRLARYYDRFFVDEVQDFGGHDFNLLMDLVQAQVDVLLVGDFFQYTYSTSNDGADNKNLHASFDAYRSKFEAAGLVIDTDSLKRSRRCTDSVCTYVRDRLGISIHSEHATASDVRSLNDQDEIRDVFAKPDTVKLFLKEHDRYECHSMNWGASKGVDHFLDVCVVLGKDIWKQHSAGLPLDLAPITRNKLYVACTRARQNLYFVPEVALASYRRPKA
jgi:DNA helicase II / ATP-dependent DNA helicase PcrA